MQKLTYVLFLLFCFSGCHNESTDNIQKRSQYIKDSIQRSENITHELDTLRTINHYSQEVLDYLALLEKHVVAGSSDTLPKLDTRIFGKWRLTNPFRANDTLKKEFSKDGLQEKREDEEEINRPHYITVKINSIDWLIVVKQNGSPALVGRSIQMYYIDQENKLLYVRFCRPDADWEVWTRSR